MQYFAHERGTFIAYYALFLAGSNFVAPVISGFINDGQGWEWVLVSTNSDTSSSTDSWAALVCHLQRNRIRHLPVLHGGNKV